MSPRTCGLAPKQPTFNVQATDKYTELINIEMEVNNIFMMKSYDIENCCKVLLVMNWLGCEGLHFIQTPNEEEKKYASIA